jgi:hypothetical protein
MLKRTAWMLSAAIVALAVTFGGCGTGSKPQSTGPAAPAAPDHLVGVHASDLTKGFRERGLACKEPALERDTWHWVCESATPLVQYRAEFYAKAPGRVEYIRTVVAQSGAAKLEVAAPLLAFVANQRYAGSDPAAARAWVEKAVAAPGQTNIGIANLRVSGDLSRLVFELKASGSEW